MELNRVKMDQKGTNSYTHADRYFSADFKQQKFESYTHADRHFSADSKQQKFEPYTHVDRILESAEKCLSTFV